MAPHFEDGPTGERHQTHPRQVTLLHVLGPIGWQAIEMARNKNAFPGSPLFSSVGNLKEISKTGTIRPGRHIWVLKCRDIVRGGSGPCIV